MGSPRKSDKKAALDFAAWSFNITSSVGIIMVNKALMATHGFSFATTLTGLHLLTTTLMTIVFRWLGLSQPSHLPLPDLIKFVIFSNLSIVGMNVSLMWNSVGFYQIAKLCMIPASCLLEVVFDRVHYSRDTKLSIMVVLVGVAVCTVTDVSVNAKGMLAAVIAVWSTAFQQYYVHYLQRKYSLNSFNLLAHTAPAQAGSLLLVGPFVDFLLTGKRVDHFNFTSLSLLFIVLSCIIAIGVNLSQFICIGPAPFLAPPVSSPQIRSRSSPADLPFGSRRPGAIDGVPSCFTPHGSSAFKLHPAGLRHLFFILGVSPDAIATDGVLGLA